jgi:type IV fimbrial biogenesis protein FimT
MRRALGFTLWELLCTLGIAGVALGSGVPAFRSFLLDARLTADVNGWVLAVQLARSEAAKRGRRVLVCMTVDTQRCGGAEAAVGWMVFVNLDGDSPPQRAADEPLLYAYEPELAGTIVSNRPFYEFRRGRRSTNGTVVFCDARGASAARAVVVSYTGRPRVTSVSTDGRPLRCGDLS